MLHQALADHPDVFMSRNKEPWFFALEGNPQPFLGPGDGQGVRDQDSYKALFAGRGNAAAVGEASTLYLASHSAPPAIKLVAPGAKIVAILRNPVERAFSNYTQHRWQGREPLSFEDALVAGPERIAKGWAPFWDYQAMGNYGDQLARWYSSFPKEQIKVIVFDDLIRERSATLTDLYRFLGLPTVEPPSDLGTVNTTGEAKWPKLHRFLRQSSQSKRILQAIIPPTTRATLRAQIDRKNRDKPTMPTGTFSAHLAAGYAEQLRIVEQLIDRRLPPWFL